MVTCFVGRPTGYDEIWCIGDTHFLSQARAVLQDLHDVDAFKSDTPKQRLPYILENYEVITGAFHHSWSFTTQIKGGLNSLLAERWKLPCYIYIFFSNDQIEDSEVLGEELHSVIKRLFTDISRSITERKVLLPKKSQRYKPPTVCVVRTVPKANKRQEEKNFKNKRRTLNRTLQRLASDFQWRSVNVDTILPSNETLFGSNGHDLSKEGFRLFWQFISDDLKALVNDAPRSTSFKTCQLYKKPRIY